ncbi:hypothetical protein L9F63_017275 [Diploptera punctata]|uniref:Uncharacterized protein n=1 Tax=Diploptera punctata TaxID=6984 RepID=A0AAD8EGQ9_DIPPU|nr:hypothetical protein L9F63_017275 [Diploptera punctata]
MYALLLCVALAAVSANALSPIRQIGFESWMSEMNDLETILAGEEFYETDEFPSPLSRTTRNSEGSESRYLKCCGTMDASSEYYKDYIEQCKEEEEMHEIICCMAKAIGACENCANIIDAGKFIEAVENLHPDEEIKAKAKEAATYCARDRTDFKGRPLRKQLLSTVRCTYLKIQEDCPENKWVRNEQCNMTRRMFGYNLRKNKS